MGGLPYGRVLHAQITPDGAHDDFARVKADADLDLHAMTCKYLLCELTHTFLHAQRRVAGADSVVFVRQRCSEQSHDPVAHHLIHRTLEAVHGLDELLQHRIE